MFKLRSSTMLTTTTLLLGASILSSAGCVADSTAENVGDTFTSFEEFEAQVYREPGTGIYIVDGDTAIKTREQLMAFYERHVQDGSLIVSLSGGVDDKWNGARARSLTYCVSTAFGSNYNTVVQAMATAAAAWQSAANVKFGFVSSQSASCNASNYNVLFDVSPTSGQPYLARAFFPSDSRAARNILIDSTAFGAIAPITLTGLLRHELGHVLGFRHEHTRPEAGTSGDCLEDNSWRGLTTYDSDSVMHYPSCNGTNTGNLVLTQKDKDGAAALYGPPVSIAFNLKSDLYLTHGTAGVDYATQLSENGTIQNWMWVGGHGVGDAGWTVADLFGTGRALYYTHGTDGKHYATQFNADDSLQNFTWTGGHGVSDAGWAVADLFGTGRAVYYTHSTDGKHYATRLNADGSRQNFTWTGGHGVSDSGWEMIKMQSN
jgi:hypothetical protein